MEFETWWLLAIPLFFGFGWYASRFDASHGAHAPGPLPDAYFRGLNFLLNEQPDKAIDAFVDVVKIDPETVELHFALGNLFRRRGETDRAIRVHLHLVERPDLDPAQREHALHELGQDYMKAGLLDRAEDAFNRLEGSRYAAAALRHRLAIAQMVRDWPLSIELAQRLVDTSGESESRRIAHFHCELAAAALRSDAPDRFEIVRRELELARRAAPDHPRPRLIAGELALADGDPAGAVRAWGEIAQTGPEFLALVAKPWLLAHEQLGSVDDAIARLEVIQRDHPSVDLLEAVAAAIERRRGAAAALAWTREELNRHPTLLGVETLLSLRIAAAGGDCGDDAEMIRALVRPQAARLSRFVCGHCGFKGRQHYWQCPGCASWDTYAPRRGEGVEA